MFASHEVDGSLTKDMFYPQESSDFLYSNPYDMARQHQYEQLHQEMQPPVYQPPLPTQERYVLLLCCIVAPRIITILLTFIFGYAFSKLLTTKSALLERVFGLPWAMKVEQIRQTSPYGHIKGWRLASFIMKAGEDIRREALVMQVISKMNEWFRRISQKSTDQ